MTSFNFNKNRMSFLFYLFTLKIEGTTVHNEIVEPIPLNIAEKMDAMRQCTRQYAMMATFSKF